MDIKKWVEHCEFVRNKVVKYEGYPSAPPELKILLANFSNTLQKADIEQRTKLPSDYSRVKINVKAFSEAEMQKKGQHRIDGKDKFGIMRALAEEFDMPYWSYSAFSKEGDISKIADYNNTFCIQLKGCNIHCPWCYVDDISKDGTEGAIGNNPAWFTIPEIFDEFEKARKLHAEGKGSCEGPLNNFRPSGGEPTLAVEQWLYGLKELEKRGLGNDVYVQGDTNLTTGHFIKELERKGSIENRILDKVGEYENFGLLCSFKGTDTESMLMAIGKDKKDSSGKYVPNEEFKFLEEERWHTFNKHVSSGIDAYPFIYDPNPDTLADFLDEGTRRHGEGFALKSWVVKLKLYGPEVKRYAKRLGIEIGNNEEAKKEVKEKIQKHLDENFEKSKEIMQTYLWKKFRINYQEVSRPGIELTSNSWW